MTLFGAFLKSEAGMVEADTVAIALAMGVVFFTLFAFSGGQHSMARLQSPGSTFSDGWTIGDNGTRLPQIGPLHTRR